MSIAANHDADDPFPFAPAIQPLKSVLASLDPQPAPEPTPSVADRYPSPRNPEASLEGTPLGLRLPVSATRLGAGKEVQNRCNV